LKLQQELKNKGIERANIKQILIGIFDGAAVDDFENHNVKVTTVK
jgi:SOS response regulatory protein OraA/RecX